MQCERCGAGPAGADLFDYCGLCGQTLCDECMAAGCCGFFPALSGRTQDQEPYDGPEGATGREPSDASDKPAGRERD